MPKGQKTIPEHFKERASLVAGSIHLYPHPVQQVPRSPTMCEPGGAARDKQTSVPGTELGREGRRENHCNQGHHGENGASDKAMQGDITGTLRGQGWTMTTVCCGDKEGFSETRKTRTPEGIQQNGLSDKDTCYVNPGNLSSVSGAHQKVGEESHLYGAASMAPPLITTHMLCCSLPSPIINNWMADELVLGMLRYRL